MGGLKKIPLWGIRSGVEKRAQISQAAWEPPQLASKEQMLKASREPMLKRMLKEL